MGKLWWEEARLTLRDFAGPCSVKSTTRLCGTQVLAFAPRELNANFHGGNGFQVNHIVGMPDFVNRLADAAEVTSRLPGVKSIVVGGYPPRKQVVDNLRKFFALNEFRTGRSAVAQRLAVRLPLWLRTLRERDWRQTTNSRNSSFVPESP